MNPIKNALQPITCLFMLGFVLSSAIAREIQITQSGTSTPPIEHLTDDYGEWINYRDKGMDDICLGFDGGWRGDFDIEYSDSDLRLRIVLQRDDKEYFAGGSGTEADPWLIETAEHLDNIRYFLGDDHSGKYFKQIAHIDLGVEPWSQGEGWEPIGGLNSRFEGSYEGDGNTIYNLTINRPEERFIGLFGLFGLLDNNVLIQNLNFENATIVGNSRAGVLSGGIYNSSTAKNINILSATVTGAQFVGSLTALIHDNCYLENIHANAEVAGTSFVGGIAGGLQVNNSILLNSAFTGTVHATEDISGGLIGWLACCNRTRYRSIKSGWINWRISGTRTALNIF